MFDLDFFHIYANDKNSFFIAGTDEVGRGPLAGPVVGACSFLEIKKYDELEIQMLLENLSQLGVNDSKKLNSKKRLEIIRSFIDDQDLVGNQIYSIKVSKNILLKIFIQEIDSVTIDKINILQASLLAMKSAFLKNYETVVSRSSKNGIILIDGNKKFKLDTEHAAIDIQTIVKGDSKSLLIGLASIFAKEYRDQLMSRFSKDYPEYGWESNAGYPTKSHLNAIVEHGLTKIHRISFKGAKEVYEERGISRG